jgi:hypothetical protein
MGAECQPSVITIAGTIAIAIITIVGTGIDF